MRVLTVSAGNMNACSLMPAMLPASMCPLHARGVRVSLRGSCAARVRGTARLRAARARVFAWRTCSRKRLHACVHAPVPRWTQGTPFAHAHVRAHTHTHTHAHTCAHARAQLHVRAPEIQPVILHPRFVCMRNNDPLPRPPAPAMLAHCRGASIAGECIRRPRAPPRHRPHRPRRAPPQEATAASPPKRTLAAAGTRGARLCQRRACKRPGGAARGHGDAAELERRAQRNSGRGASSRRRALLARSPVHQVLRAKLGRVLHDSRPPPPSPSARPGDPCSTDATCHHRTGRQVRGMGCSSSCQNWV